MANILIRDLSQEAVDRIDAAAAGLGLSRNEYLRRKFEQGMAPTGGRWSLPRTGNGPQRPSLTWPTPR